MIPKFKNKRGFTLVEMMIAVGLFIVIATFSLGAVMSIFDANRKSQASKTVVDNLNLSIENMARTIRFGSYYYCGASSDAGATNDCSSGGSESVSVTFNGARVIYSLCSNQIKKSTTGALNCSDPGMQAITSSDTIIDYLRFYVSGATTANTQPYIKVVIKGHVSAKSTVRTDFSIETLISQRALDL